MEVVPWRVAHDPARSPLALRLEQALAAFPAPVGRRRPQRGEVIREDERALVRGIALAAGRGRCRGRGSNRGRIRASACGPEEVRVRARRARDGPPDRARPAPSRRGADPSGGADRGRAGRRRSAEVPPQNRAPPTSSRAPNSDGRQRAITVPRRQWQGVDSRAQDGERNPPYERPFVFTNDFAALRPATSDGRGTPTRACSGRRASGAPAGSSALATARPALAAMGRARSAGSWTSGPTRPTSSAQPALGPGLREPGRGDGRLEPPPPRPDLGGDGAPAGGRARGRDPARRTSRARPDAARLRGPARGRRLARRARIGRLAGDRPLLGGLAVRDADHSARPRRALADWTPDARDDLAGL